MYKQPIKDLIGQVAMRAFVKTLIIFLIALVAGFLYATLMSGCVGGARRPLIEADSGSWEPVDGSIPDGDLLADVPTDGRELFDGSGGEDDASTVDADEADAGEADLGTSETGDAGPTDAGTPDLDDAGPMVDAGPRDAGRVAPICPGVCNYNACIAPRTGWCWFYNAPDPAGWPDGMGGLSCGWLTSVVCPGACTSAGGCS